MSHFKKLFFHMHFLFLFFLVLLPLLVLSCRLSSGPVHSHLSYCLGSLCPLHHCSLCLLQFSTLCQYHLCSLSLLLQCSLGLLLLCLSLLPSLLTPCQLFYLFLSLLLLAHIPCRPGLKPNLSALLHLLVLLQMLLLSLVPLKHPYIPLFGLKPCWMNIVPSNIKVFGL
ncbi:unnamed protein product [Camellia sinensis]